MKSSYQATRLTFKKDIIEQLKPEESFSVETPEGVFTMTRQEFESEFANVVASDSYQAAGNYNYSNTPKKAYRFLSQTVGSTSNMTNLSSSHQSILDAAQTWAESCLLTEKSVFSDKPLWTPEILSEFADLFTDNPNWEEGLSFNQKLEKQLEEGSPEVKQLAAEILWVLFLFPTRFSAEKKEESIRNVWKWSGQDIPASSPVEVAYEPGIGFPGTAFNTQRWREVKFLLSMAIEFKRLEQSQRAKLLSEPWEFAAWLDKVDDAGNRQMRHILLHLLFPQNFERIATLSHKKEIVSALTSKETVSIPDAPEDLSLAAQLDWKIEAIKSHYVEELNNDGLDFYDPPLSSLWDWAQLNKPELVETYRAALDAHSELLWDRFRTVATDFVDFENPGKELSERELNYKHRTLEIIDEGLTDLGIEDEVSIEQATALLDLLKRANSNIVNFRSWDKTFGSNAETIHRVMKAIWQFTQNNLATDRLFKVYKDEGLTPAWDGLSFALWGLNPERFFPIKISFYRRLAETLGTPLKQKSPNEKSLSEIISFGTASREFLAPFKPRDWTDVQSFWWICSQVYAAPFDRLFPYDSADWILDGFQSVVTTLENAPGFKKENLCITLRNASDSSIAITVNYGSWLIYRFGPKRTDGPFLFLVKESGVFAEKTPTGKSFAIKPSGEEFTLLKFSHKEYDEITEEDWAEALKDLVSVVAYFDRFKASPYARFHREELYELIMFEEQRSRFLQEGVKVGIEPGIDDSIKGGDQPNLPYSEDEALGELFLSKEQFSDILSMLKMKKNVILQGPPGVGKTFIARRLAYALMKEKDQDRAPMIQFHQSYCYEDFIQGYRPDGEGGFELRNGIFYDLCKKAQNNPEQSYFLVIDEINRGNLSKIFGELLMLIEADKRDPSLSLQLTHTKGSADRFYVPENIHLIGTMNTADRSLSVVDYALRRRFAFITLKAEFQSPKFSQFLTERKVPGKFIRPLIQALSNLNDTIEKDKALGSGFSIGHSFFCPPTGLSDFESWYRKVVKFEVEPLLSEYWLDETEKVKAEAEVLLQILE